MKMVQLLLDRGADPNATDVVSIQRISAGDICLIENK